MSQLFSKHISREQRAAQNIHRTGDGGFTSELTTPYATGIGKSKGDIGDSIKNNIYRLLDPHPKLLIPFEKTTPHTAPAPIRANANNATNTNNIRKAYDLHYNDLAAWKRLHDRSTYRRGAVEFDKMVGNHESAFSDPRCYVVYGHACNEYSSRPGTKQTANVTSITGYYSPPTRPGQQRFNNDNIDDAIGKSSVNNKVIAAGLGSGGSGASNSRTSGWSSYSTFNSCHPLQTPAVAEAAIKYKYHRYVDLASCNSPACQEKINFAEKKIKRPQSAHPPNSRSVTFKLDEAHTPRPPTRGKPEPFSLYTTREQRSRPYKDGYQTASANLAPLNISYAIVEQCQDHVVRWLPTHKEKIEQQLGIQTNRQRRPQSAPAIRVTSSGESIENSSKCIIGQRGPRSRLADITGTKEHLSFAEVGDPISAFNFSRRQLARNLSFGKAARFK